jgi:hypothetical protein
VTRPAVYIICSDQHRNGKTLLARVLVDYLLLEDRDPFAIDADAQKAPLRGFFPGRTALVDLEAITGQMKVFDTILASPGRDYVIDLPALQTERFFAVADDLNALAAMHEAGFRIVVFFVVDKRQASALIAEAMTRRAGIDLSVPVVNNYVGSSWGDRGYALIMPELNQSTIAAIANKRVSLRAVAEGDSEGLTEPQQREVIAFLSAVMRDLSDVDPIVSLNELKR